MDLYEKYHTSRDDERRGLFEIARDSFGVESGLYLGCFVHITPSFFIQRMVYVDSDLRAARFFEDGTAGDLVAREKTYASEADVAFHHSDYTQDLSLRDDTFDLLISQYAGPVSVYGKRYLRTGGILIANNSHGDAGLADNDPDFELVGVIKRRGKRFRLSMEDLVAYFVPKTRKVPEDRAAARDYLLELGRGVGYTKSAADYVFRKRIGQRET